MLWNSKHWHWHFYEGDLFGQNDNSSINSLFEQWDYFSYSSIVNRLWGIHKYGYIDKWIIIVKYLVRPHVLYSDFNDIQDKDEVSKLSYLLLLSINNYDIYLRLNT